MLKDYKGNLSLVHFKVNEKNSEMISYHLTIFIFSYILMC